MAHDREQIRQLARAYTEAWCSRDPQQVAAHYVPGGSIAINGGDGTRIAEVAEAFIAAFPDIEVVMDDLVLRDDGSVEYRWTFTGTSAETGMSVRVPGYEEWTIAPNGLIAESRGHYDQAEYERQLQHGVSAAPLAQPRRHSRTLAQAIARSPTTRPECETPADDGSRGTA